MLYPSRAVPLKSNNAQVLWIYVETRYVVITREMAFPSYSAPVSSSIPNNTFIKINKRKNGK